MSAASDAASPVSRSLDVIAAVTESDRPLSLAELSAALALPTSTVHRLIGLLRRRRILQMDPATKLYAPGEELVRMGLILASTWDESALVQPVLTDVVAACGETAEFSRYLPEQRRMIFVQRVGTAHPLRFSLPLHQPQSVLWGSSGHVILAHLPGDVVEEIRSGAQPAPATGRAVPTAAELAAVLATVRERGWDRTDGEKLAHAVGFAAPVLGRDGVLGSVSVPIPTARYDPGADEQLVRLVVDAAARLSRLFAGAPADR